MPMVPHKANKHLAYSKGAAIGAAMVERVGVRAGLGHLTEDFGLRLIVPGLAERMHMPAVAKYYHDEC